MEAVYSKHFIRSYRKYPLPIRKQVDKQIQFLLTDLYHPGSNAKRMSGTDKWEARIGRSFRITFEKKENNLYFKTLGPHDEGLGKK